MRLKLITGIAALSLCGCTTFKVTQTDESPEERKITSTVKATAWFSSAQAITQLKTLQTDKTQSTGFGNLGQQGPTNGVDLDALTRLLQSLKGAQ